ncbi:hypothetical protein ACHAPJ_010403 [Fusarium lateritium]
MSTKRVTRSSRLSQAPAVKLKRPLTPDTPVPDAKRRKIDQAQVHSDSKRQEVKILLRDAQSEFYSADKNLQFFRKVRNDAWQDYQNAVQGCGIAEYRKCEASQSIGELRRIQAAQDANIKREEFQVKLARLKEEHDQAEADFKEWDVMAKESEEKIENCDFESLFSKKE